MVDDDSAPFDPLEELKRVAGERQRLYVQHLKDARLAEEMAQLSERCAKAWDRFRHETLYPTDCDTDALYDTGVNQLREIGRFVEMLNQVDELRAIKAARRQAYENASHEARKSPDGIATLELIVIVDLLLLAIDDAPSGEIKHTLKESLAPTRPHFGMFDAASRVEHFLRQHSLRQRANACKPETGAKEEASRAEAFEAEFKESTKFLGVDGRLPTRVSEAQKRNLVWLAWRVRDGLTPAPIRDRWNQSFPELAISRDKKAAIRHVHVGLKRAKLLIRKLQAK